MKLRGGDQGERIGVVGITRSARGCPALLVDQRRSIRARTVCAFCKDISVQGLLNFLSSVGEGGGIPFLNAQCIYKKYAFFLLLLQTMAYGTEITLPSAYASPSRVFFSPIPTYGSRRAMASSPLMVLHDRNKLTDSPTRCYSPLSSGDNEEDDDNSTVLSSSMFSNGAAPSSMTSYTPDEEEDECPSISIADISEPMPSSKGRFPRWLRQISSMHGPSKYKKRAYDSMDENTTALYHGSNQVRQYMRDVMKPDQFDQTLLRGFPAYYCRHDDASPCQCPRTMTLRITLTPIHCRAAENEIYNQTPRRVVDSLPPPPPEHKLNRNKSWPPQSPPSLSLPSLLSLPPLPRQQQPLFVIIPSQPHVPPAMLMSPTRPVPLLRRTRRSHKPMSP